jgi:hypothetical protein
MRQKKETKVMAGSANDPGCSIFTGARRGVFYPPGEVISAPLFMAALAPVVFMMMIETAIPLWGRRLFGTRWEKDLARPRHKAVKG